MEVCSAGITLDLSDPIPVSRLLTKVQKKTRQEEMCGWHFMGQELQEYAPLVAPATVQSRLALLSGLQAPEVVPYQGQHGPVISP